MHQIGFESDVSQYSSRAESFFHVFRPNLVTYAPTSPNLNVRPTREWCVGIFISIKAHVTKLKSGQHLP